MLLLILVAYTPSPTFIQSNKAPSQEKKATQRVSFTNMLSGSPILDRPDKSSFYPSTYTLTDTEYGIVHSRSQVSAHTIFHITGERIMTRSYN